MESRRGEWTQRVRKWRRSGLKAREFAASIGVKPSTLTYWAWRLGREAREHRARRPRRAARAAKPAKFVEVIAEAGALDERRFELTLGNGRRLGIPAGFDPAALERLLGVVEAVR